MNTAKCHQDPRRFTLSRKKHLLNSIKHTSCLYLKFFWVLLFPGVFLFLFLVFVFKSRTVDLPYPNLSSQSHLNRVSFLKPQEGRRPAPPKEGHRVLEHKTSTGTRWPPPSLCCGHHGPVLESSSSASCVTDQHFRPSSL